jgi:hypothetical protein
MSTTGLFISEILYTFSISLMILKKTFLFTQLLSKTHLNAFMDVLGDKRRKNNRLQN